MNGKEVTNLVIPEGVTSIGNNAFQGCSGLTSVTIPNSVTSIEDYAFSGCSGLTSITIPNSVSIINEHAFASCSKLTTLKLPDNLQLIKKETFSGCRKLKSVTIPATVEVIYQNAFNGCNSLESVKVLAETPPFLYDNSFSNYNIPLYVPESAIEAYQTTSPWSKFSQFKTLDGTEIVKSYTLSITSSGGGYVTYSSNTTHETTNSYTVDEGSSCTLTFTANSGYRLKSVEVNGMDVTASVVDNQYTISNVSQNTTVSVVYELIPEKFPVAEAVDLGLSVDWASWNMGENSESGNTHLYGWGDVTGDLTTTAESAYAFGLSSSATSIAGLWEYDIARKQWGEGWRLPTMAEFQELYDDTKIERSQETVSGISGIRFTSKSDPTKSVFIPNCGLVWPGNGNISLPESAYYWTANASYTSNSGWLARVAYLIPTSLDNTSFYKKPWHMAIRPVKANSSHHTGGNTGEQSGEVGIAVNLGLPSGTKWASHNLGAATATDCGGYYAWGDLEPRTDNFNRDDYQYYDASTNTYDKFADGYICGNASYDAATAAWGISWQMPSSAQVDELLTSCTWTWKTNYQNSGMSGYEVKGPNNNTIFLPAGGMYAVLTNYTELYQQGTRGRYWTGNVHNTTNDTSWQYVYLLDFGQTSKFRNYIDRYVGCNIRPVLSDSSAPISNYTFSITSSEGGTVAYLDNTIIETTKSYSVEEGSSCTLTFTPNVGYWLKSVTVNGTDVTASVVNNLYTISNIGQNTTVNVTFEGSILKDGDTFTAQTVEGANLTFSVISAAANTCQVISLDGFYSGSISIPSIVRGYTVISIGEYAFERCRALTSVTIPNGVISIGESAFWNCSGLTSITIPNSVTTIGEYAFVGCNNITSFVVEPGNSKYDSRNDCNALIETSTNTLIRGCKNTTIPNSVTTIENSAFGGCYDLTSIIIPSSVTSIGWYAFSGCSGLTSIVVDPGNTKYDSRNNCNAIIETSTNKLIAGCQNTAIPNSVTTIGDGAFTGSRNLTVVAIPNSVETIENNAFYGCSGLASITMGKSVTSIGEEAFAYCTGLTSFVLPNSLTSIGKSAFYQCSGLVSVTIPGSVRSIANSAFLRCDALNYVTVEWNTPISSSAFSEMTEATLYVPQGCKSAYQSADYWKNFKEILEYASSYSESLSGNPVNLGLPSGTRWADHNVGAKNSYDCGGYYAWGETEARTDNFSRENYRYYSTASNRCLWLGDNIGGNAKYDAATATWGSLWRMPSQIQMEELVKNCTWTWKTNYQNSGMNGYEVKGPNGNTIFLPACGTYGDAELDQFGTVGRYWTGDIYSNVFDEVANTLEFSSTGDYNAAYYRHNGCSIRPVYGPVPNYCFIISISSSGEGSVVYNGMAINGTTKSYLVDEGTSHMLAFTPNSGYWLKSVVVNGTDVTASVVNNLYTISNIGQNTTVNVEYAANKYKLTYRIDGVEYKTTELEYNKAITPEPAPSKEGYTFLGWSTIPATMPANDVTVTGSFSVNRYKLTYKIDENLYKEVSYDYGATIVPEAIPQGDYASFEWVGVPTTMPARDVVVTANYTTSPVTNFTYNGIKYTIVSQTEQTVEVAASNESAGVDGPVLYYGDIVIPSTVSYGGKTYTVIGIGESAFINSDITSVSLPNTLTYIGKEAFVVCLDLHSITIPQSVTTYGYNPFGVTLISEMTVLNPVPVEVPYNAFIYLQDYNNCVLYVPYGSANAYRNAKEWSKFKTIVEMDKEPDLLDGHEYVDLGLPSGKCWATTNYGATSPDGYGSYLEWSDRNLISSDWGSGWTTPSLQDIRELENNCTWTWGQKNGHNGYTVKGKNGNSIFLPASGFMMLGQSSAKKVGDWAYYWTSTPSDGMANIIMSSSSSVWYGEMETSYTKLPIRPITKEKLANDIEDMRITESESLMPIYDMRGRRVTTPRKGQMYIQNGIKFIAK